uniref:Uncharacterized protein n=1 Tax=Brassica oleracea TaxID=3712 RepID=A0A3P6E647_BRAOL|nr:unnamed protein product [Brassica oleracea]
MSHVVRGREVLVFYKKMIIIILTGTYLQVGQIFFGYYPNEVVHNSQDQESVNAASGSGGQTFSTKLKPQNLMMAPSDYGSSNGVWSRFLAGQQENKIDYDVSSSCDSSDNKESVSAPSGESGDAGERLHRPEVEEETGYLEMENLLEIDDLGLLIGKNGDFKNWCCDEFQHAWNWFGAVFLKPDGPDS